MNAKESSSRVGLYALRVEGLNFRWVIEDTHDLSAIAGGSRLLEKIPGLAEERLKRLANHVASIQRAAATGVFAFTAETGKARTIVDTLRSDLASDLPDLTVAVEAIELDSRFQSSDGDPVETQMRRRINSSHLDQLQAAIRYWQMQAPTVAVPSLPRDAKKPCEADGLRPAPADRKWGDTVRHRREIGKSYRRSVGPAIDASRTLDELTWNRRSDYHGRMAVIKIDGNGFGALIQKHCETGDKLETFSRELKRRQERFEDDLLARWSVNHADDRYFGPDLDEQGENPGHEHLFRLQRLVTAGDDAMYLMPAWLAWDFLEAFFRWPWSITLHDDLPSLTPRDSERIASRDLVPDSPRTPPLELTFRAGVVICHHNAPIHRVRRLADELNDMARDDARTVGPAITHPIAYEILKSFDLVGPCLQDYRGERSGGLHPSELILDGVRLATVRTRLLALEEELTVAEIKDPARWPPDRRADAYHLSQWRGLLE